ncbi:MAG TPA: sigma-70 family RNA polymerase sigma factor [Bacteroidales bacterium]|nr:sigma-70 family RNA polymerase sigma factor [Bacteroidales bacterium]
MGLFKKYSDSDIIDGIRRQDNKILNYLYDGYYDMLRDHLKKNSGSDDDVYDVLQESVVVLYKQVTEGDFTLTSDLKGYFFGIARNIWNTQLRYKSRVSPLESDISDEGDLADANKVILERIVSRSFALLQEDCQMVMNLFIDGYSYEEIARKMGMKSEAYARRKKYLCKEALMQIIKTDPEYQDLGSL